MSPTLTTMATTLPLVVVEKAPNKSTPVAGSSPKTYTYHSPIEDTQSKLLLAQSRYYNGSSSPPGDVFKLTGSIHARMRPLGLLPDRKADGTWKELSMLYGTNTDKLNKQHHQDTAPQLKHKPAANVEESNSASKEVKISATVMPKLRLSEDKYRLRTVKFSERERQMDDTEYLDTLAKIDMQTYDNYRDKATMPLLPNEYHEQRQGQNSYRERKSARMQRLAEAIAIFK